MIKFAYPIYLYGLLLLPLLALLYWYWEKWRKQSIAKFGDRDLIERLMPPVSLTAKRTRFFLWLAAIGLLFIALANPQIGTKLETVDREGVDVIIAIDVSRSMLADDIQPSRLDRSKQIVSRLIDQMGNDRVGIIVFAGKAALQMPLTTDYSAAKLFLKAVNVDVVGTQGTSLKSAIEVAQQNFNQEEDKYKALVLITDGEDHEAGAISAARDAAKAGVIIYTLGLGSEGGAQIPVYGRDGTKSYLKNNGTPVISKLDERILREISEASSGSFFRVQGAAGEVDEILRSLSNLEKKEFEGRVFTDYEDQFQYFLWLALFLLLVEFLIPRTKNEKLLGRFTIFGK